jgi:hypothetical protein
MLTDVFSVFKTENTLFGNVYVGGKLAKSEAVNWLPV